MAALSVPAQARALRSLTGLPLAHCRRIIVLAAAELHQGMVMKRRATMALRQLSLEEQPADPAVVSDGFAQIRKMLSEVEA